MQTLAMMGTVCRWAQIPGEMIAVLELGTGALAAGVDEHLEGRRVVEGAVGLDAQAFSRPDGCAVP